MSSTYCNRELALEAINYGILPHNSSKGFFLRRPPLLDPPLLPFLAPREFVCSAVDVEFVVGSLIGKGFPKFCATGSALVDSGTPARPPLLGPRLCLGGRFDPDGAADGGATVAIM